MPNGDETVRVQRPDGTTGTIPKTSLAKAKKAGWKVVDSPVVAGAKTFGREAALGGFSGLGIAETKNPITDTAKSMLTPPSMASMVLGPAYDVGRGLASSTAEIAEGAGADPSNPSKFGPVDVGKIGHGTGSLATQLLTLFAGGKAAEKPTVGGGGGKSLLRGAFGAGEGDVRIKAGEIAEKNTKAETAHAEKVQKIQSAGEEAADKVKQDTAKKIAEVMKKRVEASAKETAAKTKKDALIQKQGPVYQRMNEMTDAAQQHIAKVEEKVGQAEAVKWDVFKKHIGDVSVDTSDISNKIADVQKNMLVGESLPIFKQILAQVGEEDASIKNLLDNMAPEVRQRAIEAGIAPTEGIPLDVARRLYTKISRKLYGSELPKDVARSLHIVQDALDSDIAQGITKKGGPDALRDYRSLQADWKKYRQTFSDKDSPLRKIKEAKDPNTKLSPITSESGQRAIQYLGRYADMGADPSKLGKIRALDKALKGISAKGSGAMPEPVSGMKLPEKPEIPVAPEKASTAPGDVRKQILEQKQKSFSQPLSKWEMMNPKLLIFRKLMKGLIQNPKFIDWLARE